MKYLFFYVASAFFCVLPVSAQFFTITADTTRHRYKIIGTVDSNRIDTDDNTRDSVALSPGNTDCNDSLSYQKENDSALPPETEHEMVVEPNVSILDIRDIMLQKLLLDRLEVCLPLDYLRVNSSYGYRTDPVYHCSRFHDGIDLQCRYEKVYSMLPAVVKAVRHGNRGYGNHVVLEHGGIECLYGHLSTILVREGDVIPAGTVVAVSGNTGKSTGPHLHLQIRVNGKSIDPKPFVDALKRYIARLQERIRNVECEMLR